MSKTLTGYLRENSDGTYFFEGLDGTLTVVIGAGGIPINKLMALSVHESGVIVQNHNSRQYDLIAEDPAEQTNHKRVAFFRTVPYGTTDEKKAEWQEKVNEMALEFQHYWQYHNRNWIVECHGYVIEYEGVTGSPAYCRKQTQEFYDAGNCGDFHPNYWMIWGGISGKCGTGILGGDRAVIYDNVGCGTRTAIHEGGHNYELHHSGSIGENGVVAEYGDHTDIMGGSVYVGFCSPHYLQMNLDVGREIKVIDKTQQVFLVPIENLWHSMHDNCWQHGLVKRQGLPTLHLSLKKGKGYKYARGVGSGDRLYVHIYEDDKKTKLLGDYMMVGDRREFNGVSIEYLEYNGTMEIARINIAYADERVIDGLTMPSGLPQGIPTALLDETYNGTWYDSRFAGQGLNVCIKDGQLGVFWFTFEDGGTEPVYLYGGCRVTDGVETFDLWKSHGGTFHDPSAYTEKKVGIGQVYFYDHGKGVFVYQTDDYGNGSIEITPAAPLTTDPRNGMRYDPTKKGSGFCIQYYDNMPNPETGLLEDRISMYWYTYDLQYRQLWFSCEGLLNPATSTYDMIVYEVLNGEFMYPSAVVFKEVGKASLYSDNTTFVYVINSDKVEAHGKQDLTEVVI